MNKMYNFDDMLARVAEDIVNGLDTPAGFTDKEWDDYAERICGMIDNFRFTQYLQRRVDRVENLEDLRTEMEADIYAFRQELFEFINDFNTEVK